jgi:hypothetical protein
MSKSIEKKENNELAVTTEAAMWGMDQVKTTDLQMSFYKLIQAMSELAQEGKAAVGDIWDTLGQSKVGGIDKPIKFVPGGFLRQVSIREFKDGKFVPVAIEEYPKDKTLPREEWVDGVQRHNYEQLTFFLHTEESLKTKDVVPVRVSFVSTSLKAGKDLLTHMYKMLNQGKNPASYWIELSSVRKESNGNKYVVFQVKPTDEETPQEAQLQALETSKMIIEKKKEIEAMQVAQDNATEE